MGNYIFRYSAHSRVIRLHANSISSSRNCENIVLHLFDYIPRLAYYVLNRHKIKPLKQAKLSTRTRLYKDALNGG